MLNGRALFLISQNIFLSQFEKTLYFLSLSVIFRMSYMEK